MRPSVRSAAPAVAAAAHGHNRRVPDLHTLRWDIFCRVIDNHGDLGVCWRLARDLAARGHGVRLWVDDAAALAWMAPGALRGEVPGVQVLAWDGSRDAAHIAALAPADVWIEAFGCDIPPEFIAARADGCSATAQNDLKPPVWLNLEYLSAESYVERMHALPSPVLHGPAAGWTKWFFYPGFTPRTGGLLREADLPARQAAFDRAAWLRAQGIAWQGERLVSLFCYEPPALAALLRQLAAGDTATRLLVTAGRATAAVHQAIQNEIGLQRFLDGRDQLSISYLPPLTQVAYDELLRACDWNFVRGEDSLVRAIWAGAPFVWQIYPQPEDNAHHAKLAAFLDRLDAPPSLRAFHRVWNGMDAGPLPTPDLAAWLAWVRAARQRLVAQPSLTDQLIGFVQEKR